MRVHRCPFAATVRRAAAGACLLALTGAGAAAAAPRVTASRPFVTSVTVANVPGAVRRVELDVAEDPARPAGRSIRLVALVLGATSAPAAPDPVLVFQGGPGQSATALAPFYATFLARVREHRDVVLLDARGTGESSPLMVAIPPALLLDELGAIVPASWGPVLRDSLAARADLTQYTTARIVGDARRLLDALGYRRVDLYGTSYGSRCVLEFMRADPRRVRTAVIKNPLPPWGIIPLSYGANSQRALDLLFADVAADSAARAAYPGLRGTLAAVLAGLDRAPVRVTVTHPATGAAEPVALTRDGVAMTIRSLLMSPGSRAAIPRLVSAAAAGDWSALAQQMVQARVAYARTLALGMSLSIVASEDLPRVTPAAVARDTAGSFLRDAAYTSFARACRGWPRAVVPASASAPVRCGVPALVVSGELDPATPPAWGEAIARELPRARHVVFRHAAHPNAGYTDLDALVAAFVESADASRLDVTCAARGATPPFDPPAP